VLRHATSRGVSAARNAGISVASGEWVAFCDDDDVWAPDKLGAELTVADEARARWAYAGDVTVDEELHLIGGGPPPSPEEVVKLLWRENVVPGSASGVVVRADVLADVGGFDTGLRRTEDWEMWLRLALLGAVAWFIVNNGLGPGSLPPTPAVPTLTPLVSATSRPARTVAPTFVPTAAPR
jgi:glycosyltransferase involved in cell wall biosynthesis